MIVAVLPRLPSLQPCPRRVQAMVQILRLPTVCLETHRVPRETKKTTPLSMDQEAGHEDAWDCQQPRHTVLCAGEAHEDPVASSCQRSSAGQASRPEFLSWSNSPVTTRSSFRKSARFVENRVPQKPACGLGPETARLFGWHPYAVPFPPRIPLARTGNGVSQVAPRSSPSQVFTSTLSTSPS